MAPELPTIDMQALDAVTGGVTAGATDPNAQIETMLMGLLESIQELAKSQQSSDGGMSQMLPMMMMMGKKSSPAPAPEVPVGAQTPAGWTRVS
jgi:hypothetical protein